MPSRPSARYGGALAVRAARTAVPSVAAHHVPPYPPARLALQVVLVAAVALMHSGSKIGLLQTEPLRIGFVNGESKS